MLFAQGMNWLIVTPGIASTHATVSHQVLSILLSGVLVFFKLLLQHMDLLHHVSHTPMKGYGVPFKKKTSLFFWCQHTPGIRFEMILVYIISKYLKRHSYFPFHRRIEAISVSCRSRSLELSKSKPQSTATICKRTSVQSESSFGTFGYEMN